MQATNSLAGLLDGLSATLKETAEAVRKLHDREAELPSVLKVKHLVELEGWSPSTIWRKAKLGELGPTLSGPREPLRFDRDVYLAHRRRRHKRAAEG
jgi:hypothetical protein